MGEVWSAHDEVLDRPVAVKIMHPHTATEMAFVERFHEEAKLAARLRSPHVIEAYDYGHDEQLAFLVMELLPGRTVSNEIADHGSLPAERVAQIVADTASALATAHDAGVIHRDVKPSNILLADSGMAKLGDFGIARALDRASHTRTGEMFGTPQYLSPEQARGEAATPKSDLYCLGVVAHEMLTGSRPFDKPTPIATALAHVQEPPPPLPPDVPEPLAGVVTACLAKDPEDRPTSAREVAETLRAWVRGEPDTLRNVPTINDDAPAPGEHLAPRVFLAASLVTFVVLACLAAMLL